MKFSKRLRASIAVGALLSLTSAPMAPIAQAAGTNTLFGTLLTDPANAQREYTAGVRLVHLELGWDTYEPQDGVFDPTYIAWQKSRLQSLRAAGMQVVIGVGLQYPPPWIFNYPDSRYVNQYGAATGPVNLTFNQAVRNKVRAYIIRVVQDLGPDNIAGVRVGSGGLVEAMYPSMTATGQPNSYWAYDGNAQGGSGRPPTLGASPFPGWKPGETTYNGRPMTVADVQSWYDWYQGAMVDGIDWQIAAYRAAGYRGPIQVLMPGIGTRPSEYDTAIVNHLNGSGDPNQTMGRAAAWYKVIEFLRDRAGVTAYVSSLADGSGGDAGCQPGDSQVGLRDPAVNYWSAARWVSYNAARYGMARSGENPGKADSGLYGQMMLQRAAAQARSCGFESMLWAHSAELANGQGGVTLADYGATIAMASP